MAGSAQGAVDSLLGRLSSVLLDEAQLLGSVQGEIQFIKDEMESMNGFLMHLAKATGDGEPNDQVRAWTNQVLELAYDCQYCVDLYMHSLGGGPHDKGILGYIRRIPQLLGTLPTRHQIAMRIRELKVRAREVSERRQRYGVMVPDGPTTNQATKPAPLDEREELPEDDRRWRALVDVEDECFVAYADEVIKWLAQQQERDLSIISILGWRGLDETAVARGVYKHPSTASFFERKAWVTVGKDPQPRRLLEDIREQLITPEDESFGEILFQPMAEALHWQLKHKKFLIVLEDACYVSVWRDIRNNLVLAGEFAAGSAIILTTKIHQVASSCEPHVIFNFHDAATSRDSSRALARFFMERACAVVPNRPSDDCWWTIINSILSHCGVDVFAMKMFLHVLYVNPHRTSEDLRNLEENLLSEPSNAANQVMLNFCYSELPSHYKASLQYLAIFPQGYRIRRTSLLRRWVADGLIGKRDGLSTLDEAERCFDALVDRGFLLPENIGVEGKVKVCGLHDKVRDFITRIVDMNPPLDMACRLSIRNGIQIHGKDGIKMFLESSPTSSGLGLLKVLDLEGCRSLKNHHIKNICDKIFLLKYLSLRNTDVTHIPRQIYKLRYLETLDIRQTRIQSFPQKITIPMLKHLLIGRIDRPSEEFIGQNETVSTICIHPSIWSNEKLEILSHVQASDSGNELIHVAQLQQLRKLGVVFAGKQMPPPDIVELFFLGIDKLNRCLRSLSIRIKLSATMNKSPNINDVSLPPIFLERLNISGLTSGMPYWIKFLHDHVKITLHQTPVTDDDLWILGYLSRLRCLRLRYKSYAKSNLTFKKEEFRSLKFLVIEGSDIIDVNFEAEAAPKLEKMVWSFTTMHSLSGIEQLPSLKELELNGDCNTSLVKQAIEAHPNRPLFKHNP